MRLAGLAVVASALLTAFTPLLPAQSSEGPPIGVILSDGPRSLEVAAASGLDRSLTNFQISLARARGVAEALERLGVASDRLLVEAATDRKPIYRETTPEGAAGNRRVEIFQEFPGGGS